MKFAIRSRWDESVQFTAEINCEADASESVKRGLAVQWALQTGANLTSADLTGANLTGAKLADIRRDVYSILAENPSEVPGLLEALNTGRVDGSTYEGTCACLVGTIANVRGVSVSTLHRDSNRPAERWFMGISKGDTPQSSPICKITADWVREWLAIHKDAAP